MLSYPHIGQNIFSCLKRKQWKIVSFKTIVYSADTQQRKEFAFVSKQDLQHFQSIVGQQNVKTTELDEYNVDWMKWFKGNTGLVGGSVPVFDEIVLCIRKLNKQYNLDSTAGVLECDAGFILEDLDIRLHAHNYMMPIDLGAKGSCLIGGNIATNAGGIRLIRYGSLQANVLALHVVVPDEDGTILKLGSSLRKGVTSFHNCCKILGQAKLMLGEILSSFELMDLATMECIQENAGMKSVLGAAELAFNLLIETSGSNTQHDTEKMEKFLEYCLESGLAADGVLANSVADANYLWKLRDHASVALSKDGYVYKHDFSLPLTHYYNLAEVVRQRLGKKATRVVAFGHVGDGNIHLNVTTKCFDQQVYDLLYPFIYDWVVKHGGSISAEHGIGRTKRLEHNKFTSPKKLAINAQIKKIFDPRGILSPYKHSG